MVMALSLCTPTIVLRSPTLKLRVLVNPCGLRRPLNFIQNKRNGKQLPIALVRCSASPGNRPPSADISTSAKIRSEVLSPFRSVRMFFYLAFIASGGLGGLIALSRLIAALGNAPNAGSAPEILKGLGIDLAAVSLFAFLYTREWRAQKVQQARLSREEILANLKLEVDDSNLDEVKDAEQLPTNNRQKSLWQLTPIYTTEWSKWLNEQKSLAKVPEEKPVYISLRMDGRVRGSGVGYPPWNAFVAQLPPLKGLWAGVLDGMDGRV